MLPFLFHVWHHLKFNEFLSHGKEMVIKYSISDKGWGVNKECDCCCNETSVVLRLTAVMHRITDLSLHEVGDITFASYNSKGWRGGEWCRWGSMNPPGMLLLVIKTWHALKHRSSAAGKTNFLSQVVAAVAAAWPPLAAQTA